MLLKKLLYLIIIISLTNSESFAQPYYFRHYQVEDGLSNNTVYCSLQDKNGFLWMGTKEGLNRFDGYHFKLYTIENAKKESGISSSSIFCLYLDNKANMWVGADKGLYLYNAETESLQSVIDSLTYVSSIQADKHNNLWFISTNTLYRYNPKNKNLRKFSPDEYFSATSLCYDKDANLWCATSNGMIEKFDKKSETFIGYNVFKHSKKSASRWVQKIYAANDGSIYIGTTSQGLKKFDITTNTYIDLLTYNTDKTTLFVRDILQTSANEFWLATESGIIVLQADKNKFVNLQKKYLDQYSISDNAVYSLCKDRERGIWAGTYFGGMNYYTNSYAIFQKYFPDNSSQTISGNAVREICEDAEGNLWIGTEDAGLNKLNKKTGNITHYKPEGYKSSISYSNIHGLLVDGNDLWIGTFEHGTDILDLKTGKVKKHFSAGQKIDELKSNFILCFLKSLTDEIYIGTSNGLFMYDKKIGSFKQPEELRDNVFISTIIKDNSGTIWAGTHDRGVFWFNPATHNKGHFENEPLNKNSLPNNTVNALFTDSYDNIWMATEGGGLCKLTKNRKSFFRYTTLNGLPSNFIFKVLEDNHKNIWLTTSKGLVKLHPATGEIIVYTKANGLLNDQFNYNSGYKDKQGKLYFGSVKGMISFQPEDLKDVRSSLAVYITSVQVQNKELSISHDSTILKKSIIYTNEITLPHNQSSVSFDFTALSYIAPQMIRYRYKLQGLDKDWTYLTSNRKVYFTNLSPGNYVLKVKASANGKWPGYEKHLAINILPPWWATKLAYGCYSLAVVLLAGFLINNYHKRHQIKKEKEIYEAKIDFFTNVAHEIRTPLTLIKGPVENLLELSENIPDIRDDVSTMNRNTNRLTDLISQILDFRQTEVKGFSLDFSEVNACEIFREMFINFTSLAKKRNLNYNLTLPGYEIKIYADEEALRKIFSNLISNAIKYAEKEVQVKLSIAEPNEKVFKVEVENDGYIIPAEMKDKIFEPFYRIKHTNKQQGTGIGLTLARSLTELHSGSLILKNDKTKTNVFMLTIPFKKEHSN